LIDNIDIIKSYLMLNNISRRQFAEKVSVNESYLSRILNRKDP